MRARKKPWTAAELSANERIINGPAACKGQWHTISGHRPLHVELGCGKGRFVTQMALACPEVYFAALERDPTIAAAAARKARERNAALSVVIGDVKDIESWLAPGEVSRLYVNFCDPWPNRKKWAKRRLTHSSYLAVYKRLLAPGGDLHFKTDNRELFIFSIEQFSQNGWGLRQVSLDLHSGGVLGVMTEYEEKFSSQGLPIYRLEAYPLDGGTEPEGNRPVLKPGDDGFTR